jgi:hypothetical protein
MRTVVADRPDGPDGLILRGRVTSLDAPDAQKSRTGGRVGVARVAVTISRTAATPVEPNDPRLY